MIRVFVVDDHRLFLSGVEAELTARHGITLIGTAQDVDEAIDGLRRDPPDVALVDVHMPGGGGLAVVENVRETHPAIKFLALSVSDAAEDVIAMIRAGSRGYVTKSIGPADLIDAIRRVNDGDAVFSPMLAGFVLDAFGMTVPPPSDPELDLLTSREKEVLRLIARGYPYKQVAKRLYISVKTVESHVSAVLRKLQLSSRYELAHWASNRRIV
jgi:DNA-binding NarL/FixJ family response regulator